jgi:hypothetical protein
VVAGHLGNHERRAAGTDFTVADLHWNIIGVDASNGGRNDMGIRLS